MKFPFASKMFFNNTSESFFALPENLLYSSSSSLYPTVSQQFSRRLASDDLSSRKSRRVLSEYLVKRHSR